jgi:hypothetical protein
MHRRAARRARDLHRGRRRRVGDSSEPFDALAGMENHGQRPEVVDARAQGVGRARRYSDTLKIDMSYVAVPVKHPAIAFVRVALPLTTIRQQLRPVLTATLAALSIALVGGALIAWFFAARVGQRVRLIAGVARRYRSGDLTPPRLGFGDDGSATSRALDDSVREVGRRLEEQARDGPDGSDPRRHGRRRHRRRRAGRLQLVNRAACHMLSSANWSSSGRPSRPSAIRRSRLSARCCSGARRNRSAVAAARSAHPRAPPPFVPARTAWCSSCSTSICGARISPATSSRASHAAHAAAAIWRLRQA